MGISKKEALQAIERERELKILDANTLQFV